MPAHVVRRQSGRRGFTLVELLVVIVIIGLLMALVAGAVGSAMRTGRVTVMLTEMDQIGMSLKEYKNENGSYPPCFATFDPSATTEPHELPILQHVRGTFRRYLANNNTSLTPYQNIQNDIINATTQLAGSIPAGSFVGPCDIDNLDPAEALVFWLGGLPVRGTGVSGALAFELTGFSADPSQPFTARQDTTGTVFASTTPQQSQRTKKLFDFKIERLVDYDQDGWPEYIPEAPTPASGLMPPYIYFDAVTYNQTTTTTATFYPYPTPAATRPFFGPSGQSWGVCWPWLRSTTPTYQWMQAEDFQLICAGLDGAFNFGQGFLDFPNGLASVPGKDEEYDNLSNFAEGEWEDSLK